MFSRIAVIVLLLVLHANVGEAAVRGWRETASTTETSEMPDLFQGDSSGSLANMREKTNKNVFPLEELPDADEVKLEELNVGRVLQKQKGKTAKKNKTKAPTPRPTRRPRRTKAPRGSQRGRRVLEQLLESNFAGLDQD